ncbi:MAG: ABC transporter ATP-binding protein [Candidatus Heimdallarchaeota archaeon]|nr:ABC transporter ATP-binding protein [Candidatus Heimdallarchaeota archaeon]
MTKIILENLTKLFGQEKAVSEFNIEIKDGEFLVLVGPSGCGKSTTLRMIAGLEQPSSGKILFDDENITYYPPKNREVGMVFQSYALYPHMTIEENLSFGLRLKGTDRMVIKEKVAEIATILGIEDHLSKKPKQLSGGQRQRVALGRAIIRQPRCFLFDEPLSNLDAKLRVQMRAEIQRLQKNTGITSIYVTHDQVEALSMADRIAIMKLGVVHQVGTPEEVYLRPNNKFVASFIGSPEMNIIEGEIKGDMVDTQMGSITFDKSLFDVSDGQAVWIGMRPEHIVLDDTGTLSLILDVIEPLGSDTFLYGKLNKGQFTIRHEGLLPVSFLDDKRDKPTSFTIDKKHIHLFDKETEISLKMANK